MGKWKEQEPEETKESLLQSLEKSDGKDFLKSVDSLRKMAPGLDQRDLDHLAHTVTERMWRERHPLVLRGSIAALGILTAGVSARVTLEAIARSPDKYPNWIWTPAAETLLRLGWGSNFTKYFLAAISNEEIGAQKRLSVVESVNAFSTLGRQLAKDAAMVEEAMNRVEPPIRDALITLLNWARK